MVIEAWCFGCCQAHRGLPIGFLLLRYTVLCNVESLSLIYLLFIFWFICFWKWFIDKLGVFNANQTYICFDPILIWGWSWCRGAGVVPPMEYFTDHSMVVLHPWFICVICVLCFSCFCVCSLLLCDHLLRKSWPLGSCWWCLLYFRYFPMWYPGSGVVLDCIISWSLRPFLFCHLLCSSLIILNVAYKTWILRYTSKSRLSSNHAIVEIRLLVYFSFAKQEGVHVIHCVWLWKTLFCFNIFLVCTIWSFEICI